MLIRCCESFDTAEAWNYRAHESAAEHDTIMSSYQAEAERCFAIAQRLDAMRPDEPGAFTGTPSERIQRQLIAIGALANGE